MPTVTHGISLVALLTIIKTNQPSSHCISLSLSRTHMRARARTHTNTHLNAQYNTSAQHIQLYYDSCLEHLVSCSCWMYKSLFPVLLKTMVISVLCLAPTNNTTNAIHTLLDLVSEVVAVFPEAELHVTLVTSRSWSHGLSHTST